MRLAETKGELMAESVAAVALDSEEARKPLKDRLHWYALTADEYLVLRAMAEHSWDGSLVNCSLNRIAAYSKLDRGRVIRIIHGYEDARDDRKNQKGLLGKRYLTQIAPGNKARQRAATYRINEAALRIDPEMRPYLNRQKQQTLPGIKQPPKSGERARKPIEMPTPRGASSAALLASEGDCCPTRHASGAAPPGLVAPRYQASGAAPPESLNPESLKALNTTSTANAAIDRAKVSETLAQFAPDFDEKALDLIIEGCLSHRPDAQTDEIVYFLSVRGRSVFQGGIRNPSGYLIAAVPACFAGASFEKWRKRQASEVQAAVQAAVPRRQCLMCKNDCVDDVFFCSEACEIQCRTKCPSTYADYLKVRPELKRKRG